MSDRAAVVRRQHQLSGYECWCQPTIAMRCSECAGDGCWNCERGFRIVSAAEAEWSAPPCVITHHDLAIRDDIVAITLRFV